MYFGPGATTDPIVPIAVLFVLGSDGVLFVAPLVKLCRTATFPIVVLAEKPVSVLPGVGSVDPAPSVQNQVRLLTAAWSSGVCIARRCATSEVQK